MRLLHVTLVFTALFATFSAHGGQPAGSPPPAPPGRLADDAERDAMAMFRFAPMWMPVPKFPPPSYFPPATDAETTLPVPSAAYAEIWQPQWQEEIGLSVEQKKRLLVINAKAVADATNHTEQFKKLSPEEQKAQVKAWAGKSAPWRQQLDNEVRSQIEAVLTPQQLQTLKDFSFPMHAIGLLYDAKMRREIDFTTEQEDGFRRIAKERLARFQQVSIERAEKLWGMLTPQQQAELAEVVKRQGPTSAVLSIAWELGFDLDNFLAPYPMLGESPVRTRLGLNAEQEKQLHVLMTDSAARKEKVRQERLSGIEQRSMPHSDAETEEKKQVEAILTPQQLTALNEINFRRQVALALGFPEKRKTVGITAQQAADFQRLDKETHERLYRLDRKMLGRAIETLTPRQREQLREEMDRRAYGKSGTTAIGAGVVLGRVPAEQRSPQDEIQTTKAWLHTLMDKEADISAVMSYLSTEFNADGRLLTEIKDIRQEMLRIRKVSSEFSVATDRFQRLDQIQIAKYMTHSKHSRKYRLSQDKIHSMVLFELTATFAGEKNIDGVFIGFDSNMKIVSWFD